MDVSAGLFRNRVAALSHSSQNAKWWNEANNHAIDLKESNCLVQCLEKGLASRSVRTEIMLGVKTHAW